MHIYLIKKKDAGNESEWLFMKQQCGWEMIPRFHQFGDSLVHKLAEHSHIYCRSSLWRLLISSSPRWPRVFKQRRLSLDLRRRAT